MKTKAQERDDPNSCFNKAADDEPIFVLRAQDSLSVNTIAKWLELASISGVPAHKLQGAIETIQAMLRWHTHKLPD